jgi:hypothetical protein
MSPAGKAMSTQASVVQASVVLTATAERYAVQTGILERVLATALPAECQVGDVVSMEVDGRSHEFGLLRRRWVAGDGTARLEITLDHPALGGR